LQISRILSATDPPKRAILDTNIVLDCLVFRDPWTRDLIDALEARRVHALVHPLTLDELQRVLTYPQFRLDAAQQAEVMDRYLGMTTSVGTPEGFSREDLLLPTGFPRCRDRDDEVFLALAYHARADGLVTKDRAVLKLRKKARKFGVAIVAPREVGLSG
jgi:putative PIN family toxin of toxin-antitoxin system